MTASPIKVVFIKPISNIMAAWDLKRLSFTQKLDLVSTPIYRFGSYQEIERNIRIQILTAGF
jgi:hypothetical protein